MKGVLLPENVKNGFRSLFDPLVRFLVQMNMNPNTFTTLSLILSLFSAYQFAMGSLRTGGLLLILGGLCDMIDGSVARAGNRVTRFGALYDSTLDRYAEIVIYFGLGLYFITHPQATSTLYIVVNFSIFIGLAGSIMVSYVRARAEGLGFECKVGLMQRPERLVLLSLGALIAEGVLMFMLVLVAITANFTAIQRVWHIYTAENSDKWHKLPSDASHE